MTDATTRMLQDNLNNNLQWFTELQDVLGTGVNAAKKDDCDACPPDMRLPAAMHANHYQGCQPRRSNSSSF